MNWVYRGALILSLITLTACVSAGKVWPEQTGFVLDEDTREPIEGAIVVARWIGTLSLLVDSQTTCYHVETATTDAQGRYRMPAWTKMPGKVGHNEVQFTAYKAGYVHTRTDRATGDQYLRRDKQGAKERLEYLDHLMTSVGCRDAGESEKYLYALREAIYFEAKVLGAASEQLEWMRRVAAGAAVSSSGSMTGPERDRAIREFLRDHLQ